LAVLNPLVWSQAVMAEVYTLHLLFFTGVLWLAWRLAAPAARRWWLAAGLWCGLGLGVHATLVLIVPLLWWRAWCAPRRGKALAALALGTGAGLLVYGYLPLAAALAPYANWGNPSTLARFVDHVSLAQFRGDAWQWSRLPLKLTVLGETLVGTLGLPALALAVFGCAAAWRAPARRPLLMAMLAYALLVTLAFGQGRASVLAASFPVHLMPVVAAGALLAGWGWSALRAPRLRAVMLAALLVWFLVQLPVAWRQADRRDNLILTRLAVRLLQACPPRGMLLVEQDDITFPLWAVQASGLRPEVLVVNGTLLNFDWYREQMAVRAGVPVCPDAAGQVRALLAAAPAAYAFPQPAACLRLPAAQEKGLLIVLKPDADAGAENERLLMLLASITAGEFERAVLTDMETRIRADYAAALNNAAVALARQGGARHGLPLLELACRLRPGDAELRRNDGLMRRESMRPQEPASERRHP
ncbi:MAG TPA: DUF2723 domain-containing protein, partial [bacterium]|nr:DUF2723 domain-containing protein [bacterium]